MNGYNGQTNVASCLLKREQGIFTSNNRRVLCRFGEDLTACQTSNAVKCRLPGTPRSTFLVAFSPDRRILASTHGDHTVRIIDSKTGRCLDTLEGHPRTPWSIVFHPSRGDLLASGCLGGEVRVWDLKHGGSTVYHSPDSKVITSLAFHPTDMVLLVATGNQLLFWNWDNDASPFAAVDTPFKDEKLHLVKFDPLGHHILTGVRNFGQNSIVCRIHPHSAERNLETDGPSDREQQPGGARVTRFNLFIESTGEASSDLMSTNAENLHVVSSDGVSRWLLARLAQHRQAISGRRMSESASTENRQGRNVSSSQPNQPSQANTQSAPRTASLTRSQSSSGPSTSIRHLHDIQATINHAIADALAERGDILMASNITSTTYQLQWWDFTKFAMPKLCDKHSNVIVERCKLHNDASTDISADGLLLSAFVPSGNGFTEFGDICVFSLQSYNLGQCLFSRKFGLNAISVSFSPLARYLLVGLATKRRNLAIFPSHQLVAQVFKFNNTHSGTAEDRQETMEHVLDLNYEYPTGRPVHNVSINAAFWHPVIGAGLVYGTNKGEVQFCHIRRLAAKSETD